MKYFTGLLAALLLSGCLSSYRAPENFDLKPVAVKFSRPVTFGTFNNFSGSDRRFLVYRDSTAHRGEYCRWISSPDMMLMRALSAAIPDTEATSLTPRCSITLYRFGWEGNEAVFAADVTLSCNNQLIRWMFQTREKYEGGSAEQQVAALDRCVDRLAVSIQGKLPKFSE